MNFSRIIDRMPMLTEHDKWLHYVAKANPVLKADYDELVELEKKIRTTDAELIMAQRNKRKYMSDLIDLTEDFQKDRVDQSDVDRLKKRVESLSDQIEDLNREAENLPKVLKLKNRDLGIKSIEWLYQTMRAEDNRVQELNDKIRELRDELNRYKDERYELESLTRERYKFVHSLLGKDIIDKLDHAAGIGGHPND